MDRWHLPFASRMVYQPPAWLLSSGINPSIIPKERLNLGRFPTPLQQFNIMSTTEYDRHNESIFDLSTSSISSTFNYDNNNNNNNKDKDKKDDDGLDDLNLEWWIKRDDLSSFDLSGTHMHAHIYTCILHHIRNRQHYQYIHLGNKVRKLEFLLYIAKYSEDKYDSVITIGGLQSNHAKATAIASRQLGLDPYLILRKPLNQGSYHILIYK